ncbi:MAG: hypothetical protein RLZZ401_219, partial [Pseudomonadota bacterium]
MRNTVAASYADGPVTLPGMTGHVPGISRSPSPQSPVTLPESAVTLLRNTQVVFYDLTTIRAEGLSQQDGDVRHFGMSKEGVIARQFMLGVVQTADGMPIYHEVFDGNTAEAPTLEPTLKKVLERYPHIRRLVVVAD